MNVCSSLYAYTYIYIYTYVCTYVHSKSSFPVIAVLLDRRRHLKQDSDVPRKQQARRQLAKKATCKPAILRLQEAPPLEPMRTLIALGGTYDFSASHSPVPSPHKCTRLLWLLGSLRPADTQWSQEIGHPAVLSPWRGPPASGSLVGWPSRQLRRTRRWEDYFRL